MKLYLTLKAQVIQKFVKFDELTKYKKAKV